MRQDNFWDVIIIGSGPAGMTAAIYAKRGELKTAILDFGPPGGKMVKTLEIENYSGTGNVQGTDLSMLMFDQTQKLKVSFLNHKVLTVAKRDNYFVVETDGGCYQSWVVIVATGTLERVLNVPGEKRLYGKGVSYCAVCDGAFYKGENIVVVGGGYGALEEGLYLTKFAKQVMLVHRRQGFRADAKIVKQVRNHPKITLLLDYVVEAIIGEHQVKTIRIKNVKTNNHLDLQAKAIFPYIGADPVVNFLKPNFSQVLSPFGHINVNDQMATCVPGLYAAGDVRVTNLRQIATSVADGARAAQFAISYLDHLPSP